MSHKIIMYTSETWPDCQQAKRFFASHKFETTVKDIANPENRDELVEKYGRMAVPTMVINGEVILGFVANKDKIEKLIMS